MSTVDHLDEGPWTLEIGSSLLCADHTLLDYLKLSLKGVTFTASSLMDMADPDYPTESVHASFARLCQAFLVSTPGQIALQEQGRPPAKEIQAAVESDQLKVKRKRRS